MNSSGACSQTEDRSSAQYSFLHMFLLRMISNQTTKTSRTNRPSRVIYPLIGLSAKEQFRRVLSSFVVDAMSEETSATQFKSPPGLRKVAPYWYPYTTMAKERWLGRGILEIVSTEFRDRSMEYYVSCSDQCRVEDLKCFVLALCFRVWCDHY